MNTSYTQALSTAIMALTICGVSTARGEDALNPRTRGDWDHENAPVPAYRQNCHPAMIECQLPIRPNTDDESDLNGRIRAGDEIGTSPARKDPRRTGSVKGREADLVAIKSVLDDLQHYNLHRVRFEGQVTRLTVLPTPVAAETSMRISFTLTTAPEPSKSSMSARAVKTAPIRPS